MSIQLDITEGNVAADFKLEFYVWTGAAYAWRDYSMYLYSFGDVGVSVEENAYPCAFKLSFSSIELDNSEGFFDDIDDIDPYLTNSSEPYGQTLYKRMLRISRINYTKAGIGDTDVLAVAVVRDVSYLDDGKILRLSLMSLDARAADQPADGETAERHPLGSDDSSAPSSWTATDPGIGTGEVALYRFREKETSQDTYQYGWFSYKRVFDIIERTSWALDDLDYDIEESDLYTSDGRRVASVRNIPPDNSTVSNGSGDMATRAIVWNPYRNCLVCCVGNRVYDYNPLTNVYTLRLTLTSTYQIVRAWYIDGVADAYGYNSRLVLIAFDTSAYASALTTQAYLTVLNATGTGAYGVIVNQQWLGTDFFPCTHQMRAGARQLDGYAGGVGFISCGQRHTHEAGENVFNLFEQPLYADWTGTSTAANIQHQQDYPGNKDDIWDDGGASYPATVPLTGQSFVRGYSFVEARISSSASDRLNIKFSWGSQTAAAINWYANVGRLYFWTYDPTNFYRLRYVALYDYSFGGYINQPAGSNNKWCPIHLHARERAYASVDLYCAMMIWNDLTGPPNPSIGVLYKFDVNAGTWSNVSFMSGATGDNLYWTVMELVKRNGVLHHPAILFNRKTLQWAFTKDLKVGMTFTVYPGDPAGDLHLLTPNRLHGLMASNNQIPVDRKEIYFVENGSTAEGGGGFTMYRWDGVGLYIANLSPDGAPHPINTDMGLGSNLCETATNYPDANTAEGIVFGVSSNNFGDYATNQPPGEYVLFQYANFFSGFLKLLDFSGLSLQDVRSQLAEMLGYVHYYEYDGTFIFKPRDRTIGSPDFAFSSANNNYDSAELLSMGWEEILNEITIIPYDITIEQVGGEIVKSARGRGNRGKAVKNRNRGNIDRGETGSESDGMLVDVSVSASPGEKAQWRVAMVSTTTYDLYKLVGANADFNTPKVAGQSINSILRGTDIPDGSYLTISPDHFAGTFYAGDNFTFWVFEPQQSLAQLDSRNKVVTVDTASIATYKRSAATFDNRFIDKLAAPDYATNILDYRKNAHPVISIRAPHDPAYRPLLTLTIVDSGLPFTVADEFCIYGIKIDAHVGECVITAVKL